MSASLATWHAKSSTIHHNNPQCPAGRRVQVRNTITGTGGKPRCRECMKLGLSYWQRKGMEMVGEL